MYSGFIQSVLAEASEIARQNFGNVSGTTKGDDNNQVLTETDLEIGTYIIGRIKAAYPDHNIIDEEAGVIDNHSNFTWVIDPIDGTSNFAAWSPLYGILLGLLDGATPVAGGMALPYFQEIYTADKGQGAYQGSQKISVTTEQDLLNVLVGYGIDGHQEAPNITHEEMRTFGDIVLGVRNTRNSGCEPFETAMVASGKHGAHLNRSSKIWDNIAPHTIIEEAGGIYTDFFGNPMDYSNPLARTNDNYTHCAASPTLHAQLQAIIHKNRA
jgi:myo-inositol-1(or 4)-monophosphatase